MLRIPPNDLTFLRVLGKGGCGEVHLAESKTFGKVAVKKTLLEGDEQIMKEFLNEAELLSKMKSPNIIGFFGTTKYQGGECLVIEYAPNGTLFHFLELLRKKNLELTFSWDKRYKMAQDITRGLLLMHSQGVLHRDMKSLNVLLDKDMTAKISDFGLSEIKTRSQTISTNLYVPNNVFGSLLWKAPETFSKDNPYTNKADIYALGTIFWEIASCQVPYDKWEQQQILFHVFSGKRLGIPSTCPVGFKELIEYCWSHEPKQRPSASDLFDRISQLIAKIPNINTEQFTSSNLQLSGSIPVRGISFSETTELCDPKQMFTGYYPNRLVTDDQFAQKGESEIERKIRMAREKQQSLLQEKKKREKEDQRLREEQERKKKEEKMRKKEEEKQKMILVEIEKETLRIEKEMKEELEKKKKAEEKRIEKEKRLREEEEKTKREEERKRKAEEKRIEKEKRLREEEEKTKREEERKRKAEEKRIEKEKRLREEEEKTKREEERKRKAEEKRIEKEKRLREEEEKTKRKGERIRDQKQKEEHDRIGKWEFTGLIIARPIKCVFVGDGAVNKTQLLIFLTYNAFPGEYIPTVFDNYSTSVMCKGNIVNLQLWDTAGQEDYKKLRPLSYPQTDVFVLCFSLVSPTSLENVETMWVPEISEHCPGTPFILVGLKSDLREEFEQNPEYFRSQGMEPVSTARGMEMKKKINACAYVECSVMKMHNCESVLEEAAWYAFNPPSNLSQNTQTSGDGCGCEVI